MRRRLVVLFAAAATLVAAAVVAGAAQGAAVPRLAAAKVMVPNVATTPMNRTQAVRAAHAYLQISAFSLKGLISQLKYEGYSTRDATYGATYSGANWFKQAVRSAKAYLQISAFSFSGMVGQLQYEGFTHAQAVYGARAVHL
jgi:hypothetical protein